MNPPDLSATFLDAYNRRDAEMMRSLLATEFVYVRPGPQRLEGIDEVMARYARDWATVGAHLRIRRVLADGDDVAMEITIDVPGGRAIEAAVLHGWKDGRLVDYRLYRDSAD